MDMGSETSGLPSKPSEKYQKQHDSGSSKDLRSPREKYEEVLNELQQHPKYLRAKELNDVEAEKRRIQINEWMAKHPGRRPTPALDRPSKETEAKYEEVLQELQMHPKYLKARQQNKEAEERSRNLNTSSNGKPTPTRKRPHEGQTVTELQDNEKFKRARATSRGHEEEGGPSSYLEQETKVHVIPD